MESHFRKPWRKTWDWDIDQGQKVYSQNNNSIFDIASGRMEHGDSDFHPGDIQQLRLNLQAHLDGKTQFFADKHRILQENGSWSWVVTRGNLELLMMGMPEDDPGRRFLGAMDIACNRAVNLTKQLLSYSRRLPEKLVAVDINKSVESMSNLIAKSLTPEIGVFYKLQQGIHLTEIDPVDLRI